MRVSISAAAAGMLVACGSAQKSASEGSAVPTRDATVPAAGAKSGDHPSSAGEPGVEQLRATISDLTRKLEDMELRLTTLSEKVNFAATGMEQMLRGGSSVPPHPSASRGAPVPAGRSDFDPGFAFVNDEPVQKYRDANILLDAGKHDEAIVAFSAFLRDHADHALAGSAQYHIGRAYFEKGEHKLAREELGRVLVSYDRSSHIAETLALLAETEEKLADTESANRHRQLLLSLFPQSPAALASTAVRQPVATRTSSALPAEEPAKTAANAKPVTDLPEFSVPVTAPMDGKHEDEHQATH